MKKTNSPTTSRFKNTMPAELKSASHGHTLVLTLSNPEAHNAIEPAMYAAGVEALNVAESSADVLSVVITGADGMFCAGVHLQRLLADRHQGPEALAQNIEGLHNWIETIRTYPKPIIAAVEGTAAGAGFSLALACDLVVAARNAHFVMPNIHAALSPDAGASWWLAQGLPRALAAELLMCSERIAAERLYALGLVNQLAEPGDALALALDRAEQLNARAPHVLASIKELLNEAPHNTLTRHLGSERDHWVRSFVHADAAASIATWIGKR